MKKTKKYFVWMAFIFIIAFFAVSRFPLFGQSATTDKAREVTLAASEQAATDAQMKDEAAKTEIVLKTYSLKYITAGEFIRAARLYVMDYTESAGSLTVRINKMNIPAFEDLLKKLDVEKRNVQFQVYTIIASKELPSGGPYEKNETKDIENRDLKRVLDEMKGLWNFRHYWVDSPSLLMVKDGFCPILFG